MSQIVQSIVNTPKPPDRPVLKAITMLAVFTIPLEAAVSIPVLHTPTRAANGLLLLVWIGSMLKDGRLLRCETISVAAGSVFVGWALASTLWSPRVDLSLGRFFEASQGLLLMVILVGFTRRWEDLRPFAIAFILGGGWAAAQTVRLAVAGESFNGYSARFAAGSAGPNDLGALLAFCSLLALALVRDPDIRVGRAATVISGLCVLAALLTGSRGAAIAMIAGFAAWALSRNMSWRAVGGAALILTSVTLLTFDPVGGGGYASPIARVLSIEGELTEGGISGRAAIWTVAAEQFRSSPLVGVGAGAFRETSKAAGTTTGFVVHNAPLSVLVELGVFGLVAFIAATAGSVRPLLTRVRHDPVVASFLSAWVAVVVAAQGLTWEYSRTLWFASALCAALASANMTSPNDSQGSDVDYRSTSPAA